MVEIEVGAVRSLQETVNDQRVSMANRSLAVRRFCYEHKASAPLPPRPADDIALWTKVDTEHLLAISGDAPLLANYLVERIVAAE